MVFPTNVTVSRIGAEPNSTYMDNCIGLVNLSPTWLDALSIAFAIKTLIACSRTAIPIYLQRLSAGRGEV